MSDVCPGEGAARRGLWPGSGVQVGGWEKVAPERGLRTVRLLEKLEKAEDMLTHTYGA